MSVSSVLQRRHLLCTLLCRIAAAGTERTSGRHMKRTRDIAFQNDPMTMSCCLRIRDRNGRQKRQGVRMDRMIHQFIRICNLHHPYQIHDCDPVRNMLNDQKVVGNKEIGNAQLFLQILKHVQDLRLNGNIQR